MEIKKTVESEKTVLAIEGWLDTQTAPELGATLDEIDEETGELELDLSGLEYISSAGIRQIVAAHKKMGGKLSVSHASAEILEVFRLTGVDKRLNIV